MGLKDSLYKIFGVEVTVVDADDNFEEIAPKSEDDDIKAIKRLKEEKKFGKPSVSNNTTTVRKVVNTGTSNQVVLIEPTMLEDAQVICDKLRSGIMVIVNIEKLSSDMEGKICDFLSGAVYVLDAKMKQASDYVFVLAPKSVDIQTNEIVDSEFDLYKF